MKNPRNPKSPKNPKGDASKKILLCLHGWGGSAHSFDPLREALLDTDVEVITPDLPGFGDEPEPDHPFTVDDYADWVINWLITNHKSQITPLRQGYEGQANHNWYLLGHSHGGRIAIKLVTSKLPTANCQLPKHLFLCAAAGIRHPRHIRRVIGLMLAKGGKILFAIPGLKALEPFGKKMLYKLIRVHDYEKASDVMRKTLIHCTQENLRPHLKNISLPTDLFWGTDDGMTPYGDAKIMEAEIPRSTLHTYKGVHHGVHRDSAIEIAGVISSKIHQEADLVSDH